MSNSSSNYLRHTIANFEFPLNLGGIPYAYVLMVHTWNPLLDLSIRQTIFPLELAHG